LKRCVIVNQDGELSHRYIEHNLFNLWQYMMEHRHGLQVLRCEHCVWLPALEYERQRAYFDNAGRIEPVDRIHVAIFEPATGIVHAQQRFAATSDTEIATQGLLRQYSNDTQASDDFAFEVDSGIAIAQGHDSSYKTSAAPKQQHSLH
jgi:hypothetical protein